MSSKRLILAAFTTLLLAAGCRGTAPVDQTATGPAGDQTTGDSGAAGDLSGDVVVDGSSTVYPITTAVAEEFAVSNPQVRVSVGLSGTGGGFEKFCAGETDISDASRPIKDSEAEVCASNNIEYLEMLVGLDGLTVVVNPANDYVDCLSTDQLVQLFGVNSTVTTWADLNPDWPAEPIKFYVPDPDSGTRDFMIEVLEKTDEAATDIRQDANTTNSSDDNTLVTGVQNDPYAVGFFGYAYYLEAGDQVRAVPIQNEAGECVEPSNETVQTGTYNPLSRPLFIYVSLSSLREKPQAAAFVRYYLEEGAELVMQDVGYSLPPEGTFDTNLTMLEDALGQ